MRSRADFTQIYQIIAQRLSVDADQIQKDLWHRPRGIGLRLSRFGYDSLTQLEMESHEFDLDAGQLRRPQLLLDFDRRLDCAYYLSTKHPAQLIVFGSQQAMLLTLYGNIEQFLLHSLPRSSQ